MFVICLLVCDSLLGALSGDLESLLEQDLCF